MARYLASSLVADNPCQKIRQAVFRQKNPSISNPARTNNVAHRKRWGPASTIAQFKLPSLIAISKLSLAHASKSALASSARWLCRNSWRFRGTSIIGLAVQCPGGKNFGSIRGAGAGIVVSCIPVILLCLRLVKQMCQSSLAHPQLFSQFC